MRHSHPFKAVPSSSYWKHKHFLHNISLVHWSANHYNPYSRNICLIFFIVTHWPLLLPHGSSTPLPWISVLNNLIDVWTVVLLQDKFLCSLDIRVSSSRKNIAWWMIGFSTKLEGAWSSGKDAIVCWINFFPEKNVSCVDTFRKVSRWKIGNKYEYETTGKLE